MQPNKTAEIWERITGLGDPIKASEIYELRNFDKLILRYFKTYWILEDGVTIYGSPRDLDTSLPIAVKAYNYSSAVSDYFASTVHWGHLDSFYKWSSVVGNHAMNVRDYCGFRYFTMPYVKNNALSMTTYSKTMRFLNTPPEQNTMHPMFNYLMEVAEDVCDALKTFSFVSPDDMVTGSIVDAIYKSCRYAYSGRNFLDLKHSKGYQLCHMSTDIHPQEWFGDTSVLRYDNQGKYKYTALIIYYEKLKVVLLYRFDGAFYNLRRNMADWVSKYGFDSEQAFDPYTIHRPGVIDRMGNLYKYKYAGLFDEHPEKVFDYHRRARKYE